MSHRRIGLGIAAAGIVAVALILAVPWWKTAHYSGRYGEIRVLIVDNLHFSAHFTWATNADTIKAVRPHVTAADQAVLVRMLGDERGAVAVAAASLLGLLGKQGEAALRKAAEGPDVRIAINAKSELIHLEACRNPAIQNLDRELCPRE